MPSNWVLIYSAAGQVEANLVTSLLEANGIQVVPLQEAAGEAYGLTVGVLGEVQLYVQIHQQAVAEELLREYEAAKKDEDEEEEG